MGPKTQAFCPRIDMLKENCCKTILAMNYGSSKSVEIVLSKSIFYIKNRQDLKQKTFKNNNLGDNFL